MPRIFIVAVYRSAQSDALFSIGRSCVVHGVIVVRVVHMLHIMQVCVVVEMGGIIIHIDCGTSAVDDDATQTAVDCHVRDSFTRAPCRDR